jgi:hypothetical protein
VFVPVVDAAGCIRLRRVDACTRAREKMPASLLSYRSRVSHSSLGRANANHFERSE